jgi:hypothetical protein
MSECVDLLNRAVHCMVAESCVLLAVKAVDVAAERVDKEIT